MNCKSFLACRNGKCTKAYMGAECNQDDDCYANDIRFGGTRCVDKKCIKPRYNGMGCREDRHCFGGNCRGGVCSGNDENALCDPEKISCNQGLYCSKTTRTCQKQLGIADYCSDYATSNSHGSNWNVICKGGLKCSGPTDNEYCVQWKVGLKGTPCNAQFDGDDTCQFGLVCSNRRRICIDLQDDWPEWPCNGSPKNCTYQGEELCICSTRPGVGECKRVYELYTPRCNFDAVANRFRDCVTRNNCPHENNILNAMEINVLDPETCVGKYCGNDLLSTVCCGFANYVNDKFSPANMPPYCSNSNPALAVFLVLFFLCLGSIILMVILAIVGALGFYFYKMKGGSLGFGASGENAIYSNNTSGNFESLD